MFLFKRCVRCWRCCIKHKFVPYYKLVGFNSETVFGLLSLGGFNPPLYICPVFGVNEKGKPHCLVYKQRPTLCRKFKCERMQ